MELRKLWEIIWRRRWIIIQAVILVPFVAVGSSFFIKATYEGTAKVLIKPSGIGSSMLVDLGIEKEVSGSKPSENVIPNHVALAGLRGVFDRVIENLQLRDDDGDLLTADKLQEWEFIWSDIFPKPFVEAEEIEDTDIIEIKARSVDPEEVAMIANTFAEVYIDEDLKRIREEYRLAKSVIEGNIEKAKRTYLSAIEEIRKFKIEEKTINLEIETENAVDKMEDLLKEKEKTIISISQTREKIGVLKAELAKDMVSSVAISENPQIENLKKELTELKLKLAALQVEHTSEHPDIISIEKRIGKVNEELRQEMGIFQESSKEIQSLERELASSEAHLEGLNKPINDQLAVLYSIPAKAFRDSQLKLEYQVDLDLYKSLLENLYQVGILEAISLSDIHLIEWARVPDVDKPASPKKGLIGIIALFLGVVSGFGLCFLMEYLDDTIRKPGDTRELGLTLIGVIPLLRGKKSSIISKRDPRDPICETYRTVRNRLKLANRDRPIRTLLVMSSLEGEGKTTVAVNLGISITREGKQVLLMDTDFWKPTIHELFGVPNSSGITNILAKETSITNAIIKTDVEGLSILTSGPVPPDPGRVIESGDINGIIRDLAQQYDAVILDSPAILSSSDAIVLAGYVHYSLLVMESGKLTRRALSDAAELLHSANIKAVGAILNKLR